MLVSDDSLTLVARSTFWTCLSAFSTNSHTTHQGQLVYAKPHNACMPVTPVDETNGTLFAFIDEYLTCREVVVSDTVLALFSGSSESADERTRVCERGYWLETLVELKWNSSISEIEKPLNSEHTLFHENLLNVNELLNVSPFWGP